MRMLTCTLIMMTLRSGVAAPLVFNTCLGGGGRGRSLHIFQGLLLPPIFQGLL